MDTDKIDQMYREQGWGDFAEAALGINPHLVESQARTVAAFGVQEVQQLASWVDKWVSKMHRDIDDIERARIADEMCCDWRNSGFGASYTIKESAD
jgi:hypothetical protein